MTPACSSKSPFAPEFVRCITCSCRLRFSSDEEGDRGEGGAKSGSFCDALEEERLDERDSTKEKGGKGASESTSASFLRFGTGPSGVLNTSPLGSMAEGSSKERNRCDTVTGPFSRRATRALCAPHKLLNAERFLVRASVHSCFFARQETVMDPHTALCVNSLRAFWYVLPRRRPSWKPAFHVGQS